jgi:hypothetical protein
MLASISYHKLQVLMNDKDTVTHIDRLKKKSIMFLPRAAEKVTAVASNASFRDESSVTHSVKEFDEDVFKSAWYRTRAEYNFFVFLGGLCLPVLAPSLVIQLVLPYLGHGCVGCYEPAYLLATYTGLGVCWSIFAGKVAWSLRKAADPLNQIQDIKYGLSCGLAIGGVGLLLLIFDQIIGKPHDLGLYDADWFVLVGNWLTYFFFGPYPMYIAISRSRRKHQTHINFKALLPDDQFQRIFMQHLVSEWSVENLKFWVQVNTFRKHFSNMKQVSKDRHAAKQLFETFVNRGGVLEVNLPDNVRIELENIFEDDTHPITQDVFDKAQHETETLMECDSFNRFRESKTFKEWAKDHLIEEENGALATTA